MGWWSDAKDNLSSAWDNLKDGDILGAAEDLLNFGFDAISLGTFSYMKDQARGLYDIPDIPYQDRKRTVRSPTGPRQVVYGRARVGGQMAYVESWWDDKRFLTMTLVVAAHQVEEITAVYANGQKVASARGSGNGLMPYVDDGKYNLPGEDKRIMCWSADGTQAGAILPAITTSANSFDNPPGWTSDHKLLGQAYVHIFCWYHEDKFETGLPKFEIELKGKNDLYDPRTGTFGYTDNQALVALDVLRWERMFNLPNSKIDLDAFSVAANVADEMVVSGPGTTEKRYTVNGAFLMQTPPLEILTSVGKAGASYPVRFQGKWSIVPGAYSAPVMDLDESDLIGGLKFQPGPGKSARHNQARGSYVDISQGFETVEFTQLSIGAYIEDDLEELERSFEFPWTTSGSMARRLAKIEIERGRYGLSAAAAFKFRALVLTPGDRITLTIGQMGWDKKVFRVEKTDADMNAGVMLELRKDAEEVYSWEEGDVLALDPPPPINLPDGLTISPPKNVVVTEELYQTLTRAALKVRMLISWDADDVAKAYDVQYKLSTTTKWESAGTFWQDNNIEINDVLDEVYDVRIRAINTIGRRSDWVQLSYSVGGKEVPPPDVPLLFIEKKTLKWTYPGAPLDLAGFLVRFQNGDRRFWSDASPVHEGIVTETLFDVSEFSGGKTFLVKAIDTTGNVSLNPAILVQGLGDIPVQNVIQEDQQFPDWSDITRTYDFMVRSDGVTENFFITSGGVDEQLLVESTSSYVGSFINGDGFLEGVETGGFYGNEYSIFYSYNPATAFYSTEYQFIEYEWVFEVLEADEGSDLTVEVVLGAPINENVSYVPPNYSGAPLAFPGAVAAEAGVYQFKLTVPQQQLAFPPIIQNIITRLDVGDIQERLGDVILSPAGTRLPIVKDYREIVVVNLTLQEDGGGASAIKIIDKDPALGPLVQAFNDSGTAVGAKVDALIQGY